MIAARSRRLATLFVMLAAAAAPAGASGQEGYDLDNRLPLPAPVEAGTPDPLAARLCDALHALPEARKAACCAAASATRGLAAECARLLTAALRERRVALAPAAVEGCERASAAAFAGCDWVTPLAPPAPAACRGVVEGLLAAGAPCGSALECKAGLACTAGLCAAPGAPGGACGGADLLVTYTRADAASHPECAGYCNGGRCAAAVAVGGACFSTRQCAPGAHCAAGRCAPGTVARVGEACGGNACEEGAICMDGRCAARKRTGETCSAPFECLASCNIPAGATSGTCGMRCPAAPAPAPLAASTASPNRHDN
jgi:hypothetical protein